MSYFPLFFDFKNKSILMIGGGQTALENTRRLLATQAELTICAPEILPKLRAMSVQKKIQLIERGWMISDLDNRDLVIAATNDYFENERIAKTCKNKRILCNVVDNAKLSDCIFGAVITQGDLAIGISTSGASPSAAIYLKKQIQSLIPDDFDAILESLGKLRPVLIERYPDQKKRSLLFHRLFEACLKQNAPLTRFQLESLLEDFDNQKPENSNDR